MTGMVSQSESREHDERLARSGFGAKALQRPELGALAGLALVILFFGFFADRSMFTLDGAMTILAPAAELGILAVAAALLMIGGEFDLSVGSMIAFAGLVFATGALILDLPFVLIVLLTFAVASSHHSVQCLGAPRRQSGNGAGALCASRVVCGSPRRENTLWLRQPYGK